MKPLRCRTPATLERRIVPLIKRCAHGRYPGPVRLKRFLKADDGKVVTEFGTATTARPLVVVADDGAEYRHEHIPAMIEAGWEVV